MLISTTPGTPSADRSLSSSLPELARLLALLGAFVAGGLCFYDFATPTAAWWRWPVELAVGWLLLLVAVPEPSTRPPESALRRGARWLFASIAVLAVVVGVYYGLQPNGPAVAIPAAVVALVALLCARWVPLDPTEVAAVTVPADLPPPPFQLWRLAVAALAVIACLTVPALNPTHHLAAFLVWLASLVAFAAAWWRRAAPSLPLRADWQATGGPALSRATELTVLFLIFALAVLLRLAQLEEIPHTIPIDECLIGRYAQSIWRDGFPDCFGFGWNAYAHLSFITHYWAIQLFGMSMANLRLASAAFGLLTLPPVYLWVRRWWGNVVALIATFLLAVNSEHLYYSRVGFNVIQIIPIAALVLATFARALRSGRSLDWVWLGYAMGLGAHTYHSAKQYPGLLLVPALFLALAVPGFLRRYTRGAAVGAVAYLLVLLPIVPSIYDNWASWRINNENRVDAYLFFDALKGWDGAAMWQYVGSHFGDEFRRFLIEPPYVNLLSIPVSVAFLLGLGILLWRWRDPRNMVALAWLFGILLAVGFTIEPRFQRRVGFFPVVVLLPALIAGYTRALLHRCWPGRADLVIAPLLTLWLGVELYHGWFAEFVFRGNMRHPTAGVCRLMQSLPLPATYYTVGEASDANPNGAADICMLAENPERRVVNLAADAALVPIPPENRGLAVLLVFPPMTELVELIRHYYPEVTPQYYMIDGRPVFHELILDPAQVDAHRGLRAKYGSGSEAVVVASGVASFTPPPDSKLPLAASARGLIWIATAGEYALRAGDATITVDGRALSTQRTIVLNRGWHAIALQASLTGAAQRIPFEWRRPGEESWQAIPVEAFNTHPQVHGLLGRYYGRPIDADGAAPIAEAPDATEIVPSLSLDWFVPIDSAPATPMAAKPSTMEWVGSVELPEGDERTLRLYATSATEVFLDGERVLATDGNDGRTPVEVGISGKTGRVPILVRSRRAADDPQNRWTLRLVWSAAGGGWDTFVDYQPAAPSPPGDH